MALDRDGRAVVEVPLNDSLTGFRITAVALRDAALWKEVMGILPSYMDADGLAMYSPDSSHGSDTLTAYLLAIAHRSLLPAVDLAPRKLSALEAISRCREVDPELLSSFTISPNLWPISGVIDGWDLLGRCAGIPDRQSRLKEAEQILRSRLSFQGTTMGFPTERSEISGGSWLRRIPTRCAC